MTTPPKPAPLTPERVANMKRIMAILSTESIGPMERFIIGAIATIEAQRETIRRLRVELASAAQYVADLCPMPSHKGPCGPEANCDGQCVDASNLSNRIDEWLALLRETEEQ